MRILVEALCAEFGGIRTYVDNLLPAWTSVAPDDEVHVMVQSDSTIVVPAPLVRHDIPVHGPQAVARPLAQTRHVTRLVRQLRPVVVLAPLPSTTVRRLDVPLGVVVYDLRHELRPEQFSSRTKILRKISYGRTYRLADHFLSISQRSLDDLHELHPRLRDVPATVTYLGADHVKDWPPADSVGPAVTFAHHTNKNPDLVLDGWRSLVDRGGDVPPLLMLGVGSHRETLAEAIARRGLGDHVRLAPFLPDDEFQRVMAAAQMVVFPSDFEGFGLPVVEAMQMGTTVVIGPERATTEIAGGHAYVMTDWTAEALADAVEAAGRQTPEQREAARRHGDEFTWDRTVAQTRAALAEMVSRA